MAELIFGKTVPGHPESFLHKACHPKTGLTSDYSEYDGTPKAMSFHPGAQFRFDSWRVPMNVALDYSWSAVDKKWQQEYGNRIQNFLYSKGINAYSDQYNVDGTQVGKIIGAGEHNGLRHSLGLVSTAAAVSLVCSHEKSLEFINALWNARHEPYSDGYFDAYYDGLLYLFSMMHLSGNYRIIEPAAKITIHN